MENESINIQNLDELYSLVETKVNTVNNLSKLTRAISNLASKTTDHAIKTKLKWECVVFDYYLKDGLLTPIHSTTKEDGSRVEYPSFDDLGADGVEYLKARAVACNSLYLAARYNQVLWNCPKPFKHFHYAKRAVDAYLNILLSIKSLTAHNNYDQEVIKLVKNTLALGLQAKYRVDECKVFIRELLFKRKKISPHLKIALIRLMLEYPQFKAEDFDGCLTLIQIIGSRHRKQKTDYFVSKDIYETGLQVAQRTNTSTKIWNKRIGDVIVKMADFRSDDDSNMIPLSFLRESIIYYKQAGLESKVKEIERRYFELKDKLKLDKIEVPLNEEAAQALQEHFDLTTASLMAGTTEGIYGYLLTGKDLFPKLSSLKKMADARGGNFMDFAVTVRFDINNNISHQPDSNEARDKANLYDSYHLYINMSVLPLLHRIFIEGIKLGKVSFQSLIEFFYKNTWLGQEFTTYDSGNDIIKYRWIAIIAPSLHEYFLQTESALKSDNVFTNYVMPIDSLTLKFEGILRDFARLLKIPTTVAGKGNTLREKYIEELLSEPDMQKYFDEDDRLFFSYLFVAKEGMNLRNNIAHCFYKFNNYNFQIMHLLICAFLRLGKYRIRTK